MDIEGLCCFALEGSVRAEEVAQVPPRAFTPGDELILELIQSQMAQKPVLRGEVGARALRVRSVIPSAPNRK